MFFFFSSRRRHTRYIGDWSSDVCSSDLSYPEVDRVFLPEEPQAKHHRPRVGLDVGDAPELATGLVGYVCTCGAIRLLDGREAEAREAVIGQSQVLMIQRVIHFPAELEVPRLREVELLGQLGVHVPEARIPEIRKPRPFRPEQISTRVGSTVVAPEIIVVGTERRLEGRRVDPIGNPIRLAATAGEVRIADQVAAACDLVSRAGAVNVV